MKIYKVIETNRDYDGIHQKHALFGSYDAARKYIMMMCDNGTSAEQFELRELRSSLGGRFYCYDGVLCFVYRTNKATWNWSTDRQPSKDE